MGDFLLVLVVSIQVLKITNKEITTLMYYSLPLHQWNKVVSNTRFYFTFEFCLFPKSLEVWGFFVTFITISQFYFFFKQETDIDNIHQLVVGATENIKEGNEDIREVIFWSCVLDSFLLTFRFFQVLLSNSTCEFAQGTGAVGVGCQDRGLGKLFKVAELLNSSHLLSMIQIATQDCRNLLGLSSF